MEQLVEEAEMRDFSLMDGKPASEALFEPWYEHSCEPVEPHPHREEVHGVLALQYHDLCQNRRRELGVHQLTDQDYQDMAHVFMQGCTDSRIVTAVWKQMKWVLRTFWIWGTLPWWCLRLVKIVLFGQQP